MHFLLKSENEFFHEMKCNRMTSFMEFIITVEYADQKLVRFCHSQELLIFPHEPLHTGMHKLM